MNLIYAYISMYIMNASLEVQEYFQGFYWVALHLKLLTRTRPKKLKQILTLTSVFKIKLMKV